MPMTSDDIAAFAAEAEAAASTLSDLQDAADSADADVAASIDARQSAHAAVDGQTRTIAAMGRKFLSRFELGQDLTQLAVTSVSPADGSTDVAIDVEIVINLSKPCNPDSATAAHHVQLTNSTNPSESSKLTGVTVSEDGTTLTLVHNNLTHGQTYHPHVTPQVTDMNGNPIWEEYHQFNGITVVGS